jgi:hypothetical protein
MNDSPPLFRLPRELRDEIYKLALYHVGGLLYTIGRNGVGKLSKRTTNFSSGSSALMRFSHRLRRVAKTREERRGRDYNQLKRVCRQLRDESSALSPHGNLVFTEDSPTMNAFEQSLLLLQQFPRLRKVAIKCCATSFTSECLQGRLFNIIQQCAVRADVSVRVHIPHWSLTDPDFVFRGLFHLFSLRNDASLITRFAQISPVTYIANSSSEILTVDRPVPRNVRFCPWEDAFDLQLFEQICRKQPLLELPLTQAALGNVRSLARGWVENGL